MENFEKQVERNLNGEEFEKAGQVEKAISLYEENVKEGFEGSHPYDRLYTIYKKQGKTDDEIRVLRVAVAIFETVAKSGRADGLPKFKKYKDKLDKAIERKNKNSS